MPEHFESQPFCWSTPRASPRAEFWCGESGCRSVIQYGRHAGLIERVFTQPQVIAREALGLIGPFLFAWCRLSVYSESYEHVK